MNGKNGNGNGDKPPQGNGDKPPQRNRVLKPQRRSLGPVPNLEEHVRSDWWRCIFNSLYLKTDGDVVEDQKITSKEIDYFLSLLKTKPDDRILDLCCGQGRHTLEMARRGYKNVEGFDRSHYLIQRGKGIAKKEGLSVRFKEGDARKIPHSPDTFDAVVILGNSFGYFETVQDDLRVLKEVARALKPWGKLLIDVTDGEFTRERFAPRSWEWIDKQHFVCRERSLSADGDRLISREIINHVNKGAIADQFYAERLYTRDSIVKLLQTAGFSDITIHGEISPDSQRNMDLGMMEKRIVVTAVVRKEWSQQRSRARREVRNITVVMGDPTKPDILKPMCVFDDDDFYTIDQLKSALKELPQYSVNYVTNHDSLIQDLMRLKGKTDLILNLCDEGFGNNPRKELHLPALFEMLEIPYTGAGPQCLAHCYDKSLVRGIAKEMGIPVPAAYFVNPEDSTFELPFGFPVITKPNFGDSSFGITQRSVCSTHEELLNSLSEIRSKFGYDKPILVEEFLTGADLTVGIIGNPPTSYTVLPILEEDYSQLPEDLPKLCGYEAKWQPDSPYWSALRSIPANLPEETEKNLVEWCTRLFERLECRDYARLDWRLDQNGIPRLLEVNPNPGWCWDGHLCKMSKIAHMTYADMIEAILRAAETRVGLADDRREKSGGGEKANGEKRESEHLILVSG